MTDKEGFQLVLSRKPKPLRTETPRTTATPKAVQNTEPEPIGNLLSTSNGFAILMEDMNNLEKTVLGTTPHPPNE